MTTAADPCHHAHACSLVARCNGEDPIGCAICHDRYLIVEVPLPWASDVTASRGFPAGLGEVLARAEERDLNLRFLAITPDPEYSQPGATRVIHLRRPSGPFATYERDEYVVPSSALVGLAEALLERPEELARFEHDRQERPGVRDLLVCTHGTHDGCCATLGYPLYRLLRREYALAAGGDLRVWRVSHFGGHRFAPTLLDAPEMRYWGRLDAEGVDRLVRRDGPLPDLQRCYRGWAGLRSFFEVVAEREIFAREGWVWLDYDKVGEVLDGSDPVVYPVFEDTEYRAEVRIRFSSRDGRVAGSYEAMVVPSGVIVKTKGECGADELRDVRLYHVTRLVKVIERDDRRFDAATCSGRRSRASAGPSSSRITSPNGTLAPVPTPLPSTGSGEGPEQIRQP